MRASLATAVFGTALLAGCIAGRWGDQGVPIEGKVDTYRFRMMPNAFVTSEEWIYERLKPDLEAFRIERGYARFEVVDRMCQPMGACTYAVRFVR